MKKRIVLCADDYGQAKAISLGILDLLENGRLSATSCMVNLPDWQEQASWLIPFQEKIDIGLHFNLTHGKALAALYRSKHGDVFPSLSQLISRSYLHSLSQTAIEAELNAQIDYFVNALGFLPHHIDGHQHVHQFPVIRQAIINVYEQRLRASNTYIRLISGRLMLMDWFRHTKKCIVHMLGATAMKKLLQANNIPHNSTFSGIYSFALAEQYSAFFPQFLQSVDESGLIMCHPGLAEADDGIAKARFLEYQYFKSEKFINDLQAAQVAIKRFHCWDILI